MMPRPARTALLLSLLVFWTACGADSRPEMIVLIRMIDQQDRWFRQKIQEFGRREGVRFHVVTFNSISDVQRMLELDARGGMGRVGLVKTHKEMLQPLVDQDLMLPLDEIFGPAQLRRDLQDYLPVAAQGGFLGNRCYYLPRKLETYTLLYLRPRLEEAVRGWETTRLGIERMLRENTVDGQGLPEGYRLEFDPNRWDWHDLAVVAHYWAQTPYGGLRVGRMAHRGRNYSGTMTELATKVFQAGGTTEDLLEVATPAVYDAFEWEAFFRKSGLYNPGMWEQRWGGGGLWKGMSNGLVFLAFMHQLDAFFIHGVSELDGYLKYPEQMETAIMPRAASLSGEERPGYGHYSQKSGWWWGIPRSTPDAFLSYRLARHITSDEFHREEVRRFGMMPVTRRVYDDLNAIFAAPEDRWMRLVFVTARRQFGIGLDYGGAPVGVRELPAHAAWPAMQEIWLEAWYDIVVEGNYSARGPEGKVDRAFIAERLEGYRRRIQELRRRSETTSLRPPEGGPSR